MEILERDFRVHIKVHEQKVQSPVVELTDLPPQCEKVQNLEYEHKEAKRQVGENGDMDLQKACHSRKIGLMSTIRHQGCDCVV